MQIVMSWLGIVRRFGQKVGPYLMLEMLLPGGTLLALLLFLWQRKRRIRWAGRRVALVVMRTLAGALEQGCLVPGPIGLTARVPKSGPIGRR